MYGEGLGARNGDELDDLFAEHDRLLRRFVGRRANQRELVDDITADVWAAAVVACRNGRRSDVTPGWLITVARRRLVDHWRQVGADRRRFDRLVGQAGLGQAGRCVEISSLDAVLAADQSILTLVAPESATVLRLRYIDGWSVSDIAGELGVTYQAAESRLARARRGLREQLSTVPRATAA